MLAEDAAWSMPPLPSLVPRPRGITGFLAVRAAVGRLALAPPSPRARTARPAVGAYTWDEAESAYLPFALDVLTFEGDRIKQVTAFITRSVEGTEKDFYTNWPAQPLARSQFIFERFGLPARLD